MMLRVFLALALCFLVKIDMLAAATPSATPSIDPTQSFDPAAATAAWLATVPVEARAKSDSYFEGGYWLILWNFLLIAGIALFLLYSGIAARLRDFAERISRFKKMQVAIYAVAFSLLTYALAFPLTVYENFFREHAYGFATQNFGQWFSEQMLALFAVQTPLLAGAAMGFYAAFRRAPRTWWLWASGISILALPVLLFLEPVFVEPLFNKYTPLNDPKISEPILAMARANQIPVTQIFEVDASRQTTRVSANVAGFLGTTRIALNDNLLKQCTLPEIREVMGHEMGHYVLNHGGKLMLDFAVLIFLGFAVVSVTFDGIVRRWGKSWGVRDVGDLAGLPVLLLIAATLLFFLTPVTNTITRIVEREADAFGLNTAREADASASIALKLGAYRKLDPGPIEEFIFYDHPSGRARIRMAMDWKSAHLPCGDVDLTKTSR